MSRFASRAVANGLRTDHPIPDLPFVDDGYIPVLDRYAVEAVGRGAGEGMWGREDRCRAGGWVAFTTDPGRHDLAWLVRWHPDHGRSVIVYRDEDIPQVHLEFQEGPLLFRSGGYWWDGTSWFRPPQLWDGASETYTPVRVPDAQTVSARSVLRGGGGDPTAARVLSVADLDVERPLVGRWVDQLALWATLREDLTGPGDPDDQGDLDGLGGLGGLGGGGDLGGLGDLSDSVVRVTAPELSADELVGVPELAEIAGVAPSTLRAYIARGEAQVPLPQAVLNGRSVWSRAVAGEWAEARRRSPEAVAQAVNRSPGGLSAGQQEIRDRVAAQLYALLWGPGLRKRWTLRWRNPAAVQDTADQLAWTVAAGLRDQVPLPDLAITIRSAILHEFAEGQRLNHAVDAEEDVYGFLHAVTRMLDWLIRHDPETAQHTITTTVGEVERQLGISRAVSQYSIKTALQFESELDPETLRDFLSRVLPDGPDGDHDEGSGDEHPDGSQGPSTAAATSAAKKVAKLRPRRPTR